MVASTLVALKRWPKLHVRKDWSSSMAEKANTTPRAEERKPRSPRGGHRDDRRNRHDDTPVAYSDRKSVV